MDSHKIAVKFFADVTGTQNDLHFVPIFHSWIQAQAVPEHLLIDVADYAHVHNGPGTCLITQVPDGSVCARCRHGVGVQPDKVTVASGVCRSETTTWQLSARKLAA